jgi:hypothetical protein
MADLLKEWLAARTEWAAADAAGLPVHARNQIMDRVRALSSKIAGEAELHEAVIALCEAGQDSDVRLGAALVREHWDVAGAADTLVSLIHASGATIVRPVTMEHALRVQTTTTARAAALCLLNIDRGRGNTGTGQRAP